MIRIGYGRSDDDCVSSSVWTLEQLERFPFIEELLADAAVASVWLRFEGVRGVTYVKGAEPKD